MLLLDPGTRPPAAPAWRWLRAVPRLLRALWAEPDKRQAWRRLGNTYWCNYINLSMVFRGRWSDARVRRTARRAIVEYLYNAAHYAAPDAWPGFRLRLSPAGLPAPGRAVLFAGQHLGPQRYAFVEMARHGLRVHAAMSEEFVERAARWLDELRAAERGTLLGQAAERVSLLPPVEQPGGLREMVRALRRGEAVMFDVDGNTGVGGRAATMQRGLSLSFLGREIQVRTGIARLAFRLGVPVVPLSARWCGWRQPELCVGAPLVPHAGEPETAFEERCLRALYRDLESALLERPEQWEMWPLLARWERPRPRSTTGPEFAARCGAERRRLETGLRETPATLLRVDPARAHTLRVRGKHVLIDPSAFRFFIVPATTAALLRRLHAGASLARLVGRGTRAQRRLDELARLAALDLFAAPAPATALPAPSVTPGATPAEAGREEPMPLSEPAVSAVDVRAAATLVDVLSARAQHHPERPAFVFVGDDEQEERLSFADLDRRARSLAAWLAARAARGERVLLAFPAGSDFVVAFFGCLYAGLLAVPCPLPAEGRSARAQERLRGVAEDAEVALVLSLAAHLPALREALGPLAERARCLALDEADAPPPQAWQGPLPEAHETAFLQYTSGSTSQPKGVRVTHANILHNVECLRRVLECDESSVQLSWMPHFHDAGLIHGLLHPVFGGLTCVRLSPLAVVKHPARWLRAVQHYGVTHSGGPNFAYELCVRRVGPDACRTLDLGRWRCAFNAAEPIRARTLEEFESAFGPAGLPRGALYPAYGLAEATLSVNGSRLGHGWVGRTLAAEALEGAGRVAAPGPGERARTLVSSGRAVPGTTVRIVDPERHQPLPPDTVGEIWVAGPSVAAGYWRRPQESAGTFDAHLPGDPRAYLRTGDLGFLDAQGELFVTGRAKELIIARGRNIYPQDVEQSVERCLPGLRRSAGAVFGVECGDEERVVVVQEIDPGRAAQAPALFQAILQALAEEHELRPLAIVLVARRAVPKTTSGKIQRRDCRQAYLDGQLPVLAQWRDGAAGAATTGGAPVRPPAVAPVLPSARARALAGWVREYAEQRINSRLIDERRCLPPYLVLDFGNRGLLGLLAPARFGGLELPARDFACVLEQLAAVDLTLATFVSAHNVLGVRVLARHASPRVQAAHLPAMAAGRELGALAVTEEGAGSNPYAMAASARRAGPDSWRLDGKKIWSGSSSWAGALGVVTRLSGPGEPGYAAFVVPQGTPGLRFGPEEITLGLRGMVQNSVLLEGVELRDDHLLGPAGAGMDVAQDAFAFGRFGVAAVALGVMKRCAQLMLRYAARRPVATGLLAEHPLFLARASDLTAAVEVLECLVERVAGAFDRGTVPVEATLACKILGAEWAWQAADQLVQSLGGRGYIETNIAPQLLRDTRILRIFEGPTEALQAFLGARALDAGGGLARLLADDYGLPEAGQALAAALERLRGQGAGGTAGGAASRAQLSHAAGVVAAAALAWAAVEGGTSGWPQRQRAAAWARRRFEACVEEVLERDAAARELALTTAALAAQVAAYSEAIGDVEQQHAGERWSLDPALKREPDAVASAGTALARVLAPAAPSAPPAATPPPAPSATPDTVTEVARFDAGTTRTAGAEDSQPAAGSPEPDSAEVGAGGRRVRDFIVGWLARQGGIEETAIDSAAPLAALGLDSVTAVLLVDDLEKLLGRRLRPDLAWAHPSIDALSAALAEGSDAEV